MKPGPKSDKPLPAIVKGQPEQPKNLTPVAKRKWLQLVQLLHQAGTLSQCDGEIIQLYCVAYDRWQDAEQHVKKEGAVIVGSTGLARQSPFVRISYDAMKECRVILCELGLTPASRKRVTRDETTADLDPEGKWKEFYDA